MRLRDALILLLLPAIAVAEEKADSKRKASTVVLDETGVKNLRIETVEVEETDFEEIVFALGRIEVLPGHSAVVSSRIPGRALSVSALPDHPVRKGEELVVIESRQPGEPPPTVALKAPIDGLVAELKVVPGQPVSPDDTLLSIVDLSEVYALAQVPEHFAGSLRKGQMAHIGVAAIPNRVFDAPIEHLGVLADRQAGVVEAAFHVPNPNLILRPGMRAEFSIVLSKREEVLSVPRAALQGDSANRFVYVEDYDLPHAFVKVPVVIGQMNDRFVEITSGLLPGDKVVTRGAYSLAFAGGGSISLKEALDAAHGHEHAEDGSELTEEERAKRAAAKSGHAHDDHGHGSPVWKIISAVLFVLLIVSTLSKQRSLQKSAQGQPTKPAARTEDARP